MPPKKKEQPKTGPKVAVDKTFGLKNVLSIYRLQNVSDGNRKTNQKRSSSLFSKFSSNRPPRASAIKQRYINAIVFHVKLNNGRKRQRIGRRLLRIKRKPKKRGRMN